jgi:hypothetical protein
LRVWVPPKSASKSSSSTATYYYHGLLVDGRVISVPLAWSWRLSEATPAQRANFRLIGTGQGVHWPDVDEDISVEGLLHGTPARRPRLRTAMIKVRTPERPPLNAGH